MFAGIQRRNWFAKRGGKKEGKKAEPVQALVLDRSDGAWRVATEIARISAPVRKALPAESPARHRTGAAESETTLRDKNSSPASAAPFEDEKKTQGALEPANLHRSSPRELDPNRSTPELVRG